MCQGTLEQWKKFMEYCGIIFIFKGNTADTVQRTTVPLSRYVINRLVRYFFWPRGTKGKKQ